MSCHDLIFHHFMYLSIPIKAYVWRFIDIFIINQSKSKRKPLLKEKQLICFIDHTKQTEILF